jgi:hypothetical protein
MVVDMVSLLGCATRFDDRYNLLRAAVAKDRAAARQLRAELAAAGGEESAMALARQELGARGGFIPLAPHFPVRESYDSGYSIPWGARDYKLASWMEENAAEWQQQGTPQQQAVQQQRGRLRRKQAGGGGREGGAGGALVGGAATLDSGRSSSSSEAIVASVRGGAWPLEVGELR